MAALAVLASASSGPRSRVAEVRVAQITDTHLGEARAPHAAENLRRVVELVNAEHPDVIVVTGDIGENYAEREQARQILAAANAPVRYIPGNHDLHGNDLAQYRAQFGKDYYTFRVKHVTFVALDSQLLGNYDDFAASIPQPVSANSERESQKMLDWMAALARKSNLVQAPHSGSAAPESENIVVGLQHIPAYRSPDFPDSKPYWIISEPYRSREVELLHALNVHHVLAGHWHLGRVFDADGITWHVAPATSWLPWGGRLGFALHTIDAQGEVRTEFIDFDGNVSVAENMGESPESLCRPDPQRSVRICQPIEGAVASPLNVLAVAHGDGLVQVIQIYVDGEKKYENAGDIMNTKLALPAGKHELIVQGLDRAGFFRSRVFVDVEATN